MAKANLKGEVIEMTFFSAWSNFTDSLVGNIRAAVEAGNAEPSDTVWCGPDGSAVIASDPATLGEDYAEYVDSGLVEEYID